MDINDALTKEPFILAEGAIIERLRRAFEVSLDPHVAHAGFVYDERGRAALESVYRAYLDVGRDHGLPMIVLTPTWRASPHRLARAGLRGTADVNRDCARFMAALVGKYGGYATKVYVGGLMGCAGYAYRPDDALPTDEARSFHRPQAQALAAAHVDFLMAATLPALCEARGLALVMAGTGTPYILSFVARPDGTLLDGTPLHKAIDWIDSTVRPAPLCYMLSGLQANTSPRPPEELDNLACLEGEDPESLAEAMVHLYDRFGTKILGGCCGTDDRHIRRIAARMTARLREPSPSHWR